MPRRKASNENAAPRQACTFAREGAVTFADDGDKDKGNRFSIVGYSGEIIPDHWWWGNLAFDLGGMKFAGKKTPVLDSHFTDRRLGFATKQAIAEKVTFEGQFLSNDRAQEFRNDVGEGFPMQASLYCPPRSVEYVKEGETTEVNGKTLKGPGAVFRKSTIKEVSMCVFGADGRTSATAFDDGDNDKTVQFSVKEHIMPNETTHPMPETLTVDRLKSEFAEVHADVFKAGQADGAEAERARFKTLQTACGDDTELLVSCFADGKTETQALQLRNERLASQLAAASKQSAAPATATPAVDPAVTEFAEQTPGQAPNAQATEGPATFDAAVKAYMAEHNATEGQAIDKCVELYPKLYEAERDAH